MQTGYDEGARAEIARLRDRIADLEGRVAALDGRAPAAPTAFDVARGDQFGEVRDLLQRGNKIEAIKRYRLVTGVGLAEAKDAVERL